jgi:hypothetical protein
MQALEREYPLASARGVSTWVRLPFWS